MSETQKSVAQWCFETFPQYQGKQALSVIEEAIELAWETGSSREEIIHTLSVAVGRLVEKSERSLNSVSSEAADVLICLHSLAEEFHFDLWHAEKSKMKENRIKSAAEHNSKIRAIIGEKSKSA